MFRPARGSMIDVGEDTAEQKHSVSFISKKKLFSLRVQLSTSGFVDLEKLSCQGQLDLTPRLNLLPL